LLQSRGKVLQITSIMAKRARPVQYPCATDCRATDIVLCKDISAAGVPELVEHDVVIPDVIINSVVDSPRALPIRKIQIRFLAPRSVRNRKGHYPKEY
jgi:hypothetical protein